LERACRALACSYNPAPFRAIYAHLSDSPASKSAAQALEYLSHLLPHKVFQSARRVLETSSVDADARDETRNASKAPGTREEPAEPKGPDDEQVRLSIEQAWRNGDEWLRVCAVACARAWPALAIRL